MATSVRNSGGSINDAPVVTDLKTVGKINQTDFTIQYKVTDEQLQIVRHYLYLNGKKIKEITKDVNYESPNDVFTYKIEGLEMGATYTVQIICDDGLDEGKSNAIQVTTIKAEIWGIRIDENNSNPESSVSYIENAIGKTPAKRLSGGEIDWSDWKNEFPFNKIRPCGLKNGKVFKYININNHTLYEDGTKVGEDVDVMIEFPKIYWKFKNDGRHVNIRISDVKLDSGFLCLAHMIGTKEVDKIYLPEYEGSVIGGKLRSLPNKVVQVNANISQFRNWAHANGAGYQQFLYYQNMLLDILYLIVFKNRNSQTALGAGVSGEKGKINTGTLATKGMMYGTTNNKQGVKFLGIENWYGNVYKWVDGMFHDASKNILISKQNVFNDNGNGYENCGRSGVDTSGNLGTIQGGTKTGFLGKTFNGSGTTHYCDYSDLYAGYLPVFGGAWSLGAYVGAFYWYVGCTASYADSNVGGRLSYIGGV